MMVSTRRSWKDIRAERATSVEDFVEEVDEARLRMDLAQFVYDLRDAAGITQKELAERMGTTQSAIARLEGGGTNPSAELLQRLGHALNVRLVLTVEGRRESAQPVVISKTSGKRAS
jgi:ribosome-binding protein aMBF1 (putative translation factor)